MGGNRLGWYKSLVQIHLHPLVHRPRLDVLPQGTGWAHLAQAVSRVCSQVLSNWPVVGSELPGEIVISEMPASRRASTAEQRLAYPLGSHGLHTECVGVRDRLMGTAYQQPSPVPVSGILKGAAQQRACRLNIPKPEPEWFPADCWPRPIVLDAQSYSSFTVS